jgi:hypothetical protein
MNSVSTTHCLGCVRREGSELYSSIYIPFKDAKRHGPKADFDLNWDQSTISVLHSPLLVLFLLRFPTMHDIISQTKASPSERRGPEGETKKGDQPCSGAAGSSCPLPA